MLWGLRVQGFGGSGLGCPPKPDTSRIFTALGLREKTMEAWGEGFFKVLSLFLGSHIISGVLDLVFGGGFTVPRPSIYPLLDPTCPLFGARYPFLRAQGGSWLLSLRRYLGAAP